MIHHGVDLIAIERIRQVVARYGNRFLARIYTSAELERYRDRPASLAARWAAKEATAKLLGVGLRGLGAGIQSEAVAWTEVEILADPNGRPTIRLHGSAAQRAQDLRLESFAVSLSHTHDLAIASVVALERRPASD